MNENCLKVQMFGKFQLSYNNQIINLGHNHTTRALQLLQMLLYAGSAGIHRSQILQNLFGGEAEGNVSSNLRVVVYNLRKFLVQAGLPDENYIQIESGVYRFVSDFQVVLDVKEFEHLIDEAKIIDDHALAEEAKDAAVSEKIRLLRQACDLYEGYFLPELTGEDWVTVAGAHFQYMYFECMEMLAELMKAKKQYNELYQLCNHASALYPFDEWQVYEIECLLAMGDADAALKLYDATTTMYFDELAMPASERMLECFSHMREKIQMTTGDFNEIQQGLKEQNYANGAYFCQYPSFVDGYRMMIRMMERSGQSVYLLLCTVSDENGRLYEDHEWLKDVSEGLYDSIQGSLRRSDVFTRYNLKQYLVMLIGIRKEECSIVTNRIDLNFRKRFSNRKLNIRYKTASVLDL